MKKLLVLSAPSGAGKTTLCQRLLRDFPNQLVLSISSTTRAPRGQEKHGKEYYFLSREEFERGIQEGKFAEWATVHKNHYGTSRAAIEAAFSEGKSVLLDIDVQGAASLRKAFPKECFSIFVSPPSLEVLEQRLRARNTDPEETIRLRMENARQEMEAAKSFDKVILNQDLETAYRELRALVTQILQSGTGGSKPIG